MAGTNHRLRSRSSFYQTLDSWRAEPRRWWQRTVAGERLPSGLTASLNARSKCQGTIEDHRNTALDVREVFEQRVGSCVISGSAYCG